VNSQALSQLYLYSRTASILVQCEVPKPSDGLEYTFARRPSSFDHERKDIAHVWEVGRGHGAWGEATR
jgi:hypothetical protein